MVLGFAWVACCCLGISQTAVARFTHKLQKCEKEAKKNEKKSVADSTRLQLC